MKPKLNYANQPRKDQCQTPPYAVQPLMDHIGITNLHVWEPACGEGYLSAALTVYDEVALVTSTDILQGHDFLDMPVPYADCIITNPPYSQKLEWLARCIELEMPWALLLPLETLGSMKAQQVLMQAPLELILLDGRVDFKMPDKGWAGKAQFPVGWFTSGMKIGRDITYGKLDKKAKKLFHDTHTWEGFL